MTQVDRASQVPVDQVAGGRGFAAWAAVRNIRNQEQLFRDIEVAQAVSQASSEEVARRLGIEPDALVDVVSGRADLTMTELRMLASACEVVLEYKAVPASSVRRQHAAVSAWLCNISTRELASADGREDWKGVATSELFHRHSHSWA